MCVGLHFDSVIHEHTGLILHSLVACFHVSPLGGGDVQRDAAMQR